MSWQNVVLSVVSWVFTVALIPSILSPHKPSAWSSLMTWLGLLIIGVVYATLGLWLACASTLVCACAWGVLLVQKVAQNAQR